MAKFLNTLKRNNELHFAVDKDLCYVSTKNSIKMSKYSYISYTSIT